MNNRIIQSKMKQTAVYWGNPVQDGYGGYTYDDPVEFKVNWMEKQEKFVNKMAEEHISQAVVYLPSDVVVQGQIALTDLLSLSSSQTPVDNDAFEIKAYAKTPEQRGVNFVRKIWL